MFKSYEAARLTLAVAKVAETADALPVLLSVIDNLLTDDGRRVVQHLMNGLRPCTYNRILDMQTALRALHCAHENEMTAAEMIAHFGAPEEITIGKLILWRIRNRSHAPRDGNMTGGAYQWYQTFKAQRAEAALPEPIEQLEDNEPDDTSWPSEEEMERFAQYQADLGADRGCALLN